MRECAERLIPASRRQPLPAEALNDAPGSIVEYDPRRGVPLTLSGMEVLTSRDVPPGRLYYTQPSYNWFTWDSVTSTYESMLAAATRPKDPAVDLPEGL